MIILGLILLLIGFLAHIAIVWTIGIVVLVLGLIAVLLGSIGHPVGGRRHYWCTGTTGEVARRAMTTRRDFTPPSQTSY